MQEYSLKKFKELPKYTFYKKTGPQHKPIFKTDVQIPNSKKFIGTGTSKKNAQQNAANKLLHSLKKWFKNIIIISHIDAIKDVVDNVIDIRKKGVDSYVYQP